MRNGDRIGQRWGRRCSQSVVNSRTQFSVTDYRGAISLGSSIVLAGLFVVLVVAATPAVADTPVDGDPDLEVSVGNNTLEIGDDQVVGFRISNQGEVTTNGTHPPEVRNLVTEAQSVNVSINDTPDEIFVETGEQSLGTIQRGESVVAPFQLLLSEDAERGEEYTLSLEVSYTDTDVTDYEVTASGTQINSTSERRVEEFEVPFETADEETDFPIDGFGPQFEILDFDHDVQVDGTGTVTLEVRNNGSETATDVSATATTPDQDIFIGSGGPTSTRYLGDWNPGEERTISFRTGTTSNALTEPYLFEVSLEYNGIFGVDGTESESFSLQPLPRQQYVVQNLSHQIVIGDDGIMQLELENTGPEAVEDATVTLTTNDAALNFGEATGGSPTTQKYIGDWGVNETKVVTARVTAAPEAIQSEYSLDATVSALGENDRELTDQTLDFGVTPLSPQRYTITNVSHDVAINDNGILRLEVHNQGIRNITDASVTVSTNDQAIRFGAGGSGEAVQFQDVAFEADGGGSPTSEAFVGDWDANETRTVLFRTGATEQALQRNYTIDVAIDGRDENDNPLTTRNRQFGLEPLAEQTFAIEKTEQSLRVGEDGDVVGTITNTGEQTVENTVLLFASDIPNVFPRETQYAVGTLEPGEVEEFRFRIGLSEEAEPGPRVFEFDTRYRNHNDEVRIAESQDLQVAVGPELETFTFEAINATFTPGSSGTVTMEIENNRDERVENLRVKMFSNLPLDSSDDETFVDALEPGESTTLAFDLSVADSAMPKDYSVSMDARYTDERGVTTLSGTYRVPITVVQSEDEGLPLVFVGIALLIVAGLAFVFRTRIATIGRDLHGRMSGPGRNPDRPDED